MTLWRRRSIWAEPSCVARNVVQRDFWTRAGWPTATYSPTSIGFPTRSSCWPGSRRERGKRWLSRARVHDRHLEVGLEELARAAGGAARRLGVAGRDRAALVAALVRLPSGARHHGRALE